MREADLIASFSAIKAGLDEAIKEAKPELLAVAGEVGVKSFSTPWGAVTVAQSDEEWRVRLDPAGFLAWVQANHPDEVETVTPEPVTRVKPMFEALFTKRLVRAGRSVLDSDTGEVVEFAEPVHVPAGDPYVTYPASKEQRAAKDAAKAWVADVAQMLTEGLRERTALAAGDE